MNLLRPPFYSLTLSQIFPMSKNEFPVLNSIQKSSMQTLKAIAPFLKSAADVEKYDGPLGSVINPFASPFLDLLFSSIDCILILAWLSSFLKRSSL